MTAELPPDFTQRYPGLEPATLKAVRDVLAHVPGPLKPDLYQHLAVAGMTLAWLRELAATRLTITIPRGERTLDDVVDELMIDSAESLGIEPRDFRYMVYPGPAPKLEPERQREVDEAQARLRAKHDKERPGEEQ